MNFVINDVKRMKNSHNYRTRIGKSSIHGKGVFSVVKIPAKRKIGTMGGNIIKESIANKKLKRLEVIKMVELGDGKVLDGSVNGNELSHVNHSCSPNTYTRVIGNQVEFYSLRNIKSGEELTCSYGESYHEGKKRCLCGTENCKGYL